MAPKLTVDIRVWDPDVDLPREKQPCSEKCQGCGTTIVGEMRLVDFYRRIDYHRTFECPTKGQKPNLGVR